MARLDPFHSNSDPGDEQPEAWRECEECGDTVDTFTLRYARLLCAECAHNITTPQPRRYEWRYAPEDE